MVTQRNIRKKERAYYRCWNCQGLIKPFTNPCPFCRVGIDWSASTNLAAGTDADAGFAGANADARI